MFATLLFNKFPLVTAIFTSALDSMFLLTAVEPIVMSEFLFIKFTVFALVLWFTRTLPLIFIPLVPSLYTSKVELSAWFLVVAPDLIKPVVSTNKPLVAFSLRIVNAPLGFETSPAIEIPSAPVLVIVMSPLEAKFLTWAPVPIDVPVVDVITILPFAFEKPLATFMLSVFTSVSNIVFILLAIVSEFVGYFKASSVLFATPA